MKTDETSGIPAPLPTFAALWRKATSDHGGRPFLIWERPPDGLVTTTWTYGEFDREVRRLARVLGDLGVSRGTRVHLVLPNCPMFIGVWLAAAQLGAAIVPADPTASPREYSRQIAKARPVLGVCGGSDPSPYLAAAEGKLRILQVSVVDLSIPSANAEPLEWAAEDEPRDIDEAAILFTSGTTSEPKGVLVTQANYSFAGETMARAANLTRSDRYMVTLPMFHANAQYYCFAPAIARGASVALMPTFSASRFLEQAARHQVTHASLFAAPMRMILARGRRTAAPTLRHVWYAQNVSDDQYRLLAEMFGCRPRQLYGMTETIAAVLTSDGEASSPNSMGRPTPGCQVYVVDQADRPVGAEESGELVVRGIPGHTLFAGYVGMEHFAMRDMAFHTGDHAWFDGSGDFYFAGRDSDILKVAGENVSTSEIEAVLAAHPVVFEAAVVGRPDPVMDEVPVAYVVPSSAVSPESASELHAFCARELAKSKRPTEFIFVDELPRTSVGKIRKYELRAGAVRQPSTGDEQQLA